MHPRVYLISGSDLVSVTRLFKSMQTTGATCPEWAGQFILFDKKKQSIIVLSFKKFHYI